MRKSLIAAMLAAITIGAVAGGVAISASQEDTKLQIAAGETCQLKTGRRMLPQMYRV